MASRAVLDGAALDTAIDEARAGLAALLRAPGGASRAGSPMPRRLPAGAASWDEYWRDVGLPEEDLDIGQDRIADPEDRDPQIWFQRVPDAKTIKNRLHIDIHAGGGRGTPLEVRRQRVDTEASRPAALGAARLRVMYDEGIDHYAVAMRDPEGNEFDIN